MNGIINLNKPSGSSSARCVSIAKHSLKGNQTKFADKIGHMGTLDPMGCGVLLIGVGKAARLFDWYLKHDKSYVADFVFGCESDSLDVTGNVTSTTKTIPTLQQIQDVIPKFLGAVQQLPPIYSAKSVGGTRAYVLARQGKPVDLRPSTVQIHDIKVLKQLDCNAYRFEIVCGSGTYIRSIGRDIAYACDSLATMSYICRTRCGQFELTDSIGLDCINSQSLIPLTKALPQLPKLELGEGVGVMLQKGAKVYLECDTTMPHIVYCGTVLYGIGEVREGRLVMLSNLFDSTKGEE